MSILRNNDQQFSLLAKSIHWLSALLVVFLFALGLWMTDLDYYSDWYQKGPNLHIGIGVCLAVVTIFRLIYRATAPFPKPVPGTTPAVALAGKAAHLGLYVLLIILFISGYLIVTAEGEALDVFGWFTIPSLFTSENNLQDTAGEIHEWLAFTLIGLASLHAAAALWHHFKLHDATLMRMITRAKQQ